MLSCKRIRLDSLPKRDFQRKTGLGSSQDKKRHEKGALVNSFLEMLLNARLLGMVLKPVPTLIDRMLEIQNNKALYIR